MDFIIKLLGIAFIWGAVNIDRKEPIEPFTKNWFYIIILLVIGIIILKI